jgi:transcriptional regulator with XRE-family HTH domain
MNKLNRFLELRPAINVSAFAKEVGCSRQMLDYIRNGKYNPSPALQARLLKAYAKYGYKTKDK